MKTVYIAACLAASFAAAAQQPAAARPGQPALSPSEEQLAARESEIDAFVALLESIKDQESADAAAASARMHIERMMLDSEGIPVNEVPPEKVQAFFDKLMHMQGLLQQLAAADYHGSDSLKRIFGEARQMAQQQAQDGAQEPESLDPKENKAAYDGSMKAAAHLHSLLEGIKDKATADAASGKIGQAFIEMRRSRQTPFDAELLAPEELEAFNELVENIQQQFSDLLKVDFYGSQSFVDALNQAVAAVEPEGASPLPEEVWQEMLPAMQELNEAMVGILAQVSDRASADAAATKIKALAPSMQKISALGKGYERCVPTPEQADQLESMKRRAAEILLPLYQKNFYGSSALRNALEDADSY